jgi:hypothetical protein
MEYEPAEQRNIYMPGANFNRAAIGSIGKNWLDLKCGSFADSHRRFRMEWDEVSPRAFYVEIENLTQLRIVLLLLAHIAGTCRQVDMPVRE